MITCSVCGHLNSPERATCEECGSDLSDSPDWGVFDDDEPPARVCAVALRHNAMSAVRKNTFFITSYFLVYAKIRLTALICKSFQPNG